MTCIRRARSVWSTCPCDDCRQDAYRQRKRNDAGLYRRVPSEAAWAVIDDRLARGWSSDAIASAAGLSFNTVRCTLYLFTREGIRRELSPGIAAAIVNMGAPTRGNVSGTPARRKLQALSRLGYSLAHMAGECGLGESTLAAIRGGGKCNEIRSRHDQVIAAMYDRLHMTPGPSKQARSTAVRRGWLGPMAWDHIDNLAEAPDVGAEADESHIDTAAVLRRMEGEQVPLNAAERAELVRRWKESGRSLKECAAVCRIRIPKVGEAA